ncbi:MAG TPA: hypothetical protein DCR13_03320 [Gammaproteobacteria bacterium]|nr:hypothetical protein [Gammaproteobacteria bacterium]
MNNTIKKWQYNIDSLTLRERILLQAIIIMIIMTLFNTLLIEEISNLEGSIQEDLDQIERKTYDTQQQIIQDTQVLQEKKQIFIGEKEYFTKLTQKIISNNEQLEIKFDRLVPPDKMINLLRNLLVETDGLSIVSINNEAVEEISIDRFNENELVQEDKIILYGHSATIQLSGTYQQIYNYLLAIENTQWDIFWNSLQYNVISYPIAEVTLRVMTVSTDKHWIGS